MQKKVRKLSHRLLPVVCDGHKEETACAAFQLDLKLEHARDGPGIALHVWVHFSTTPIEKTAGVIALTVKRCRLCLDLTNASIPLKDRGLKTVMPLKIVRTIETGRSHTDSAARGSDLKGSAKLNADGPTISGGLGFSRNWKTEDEDVLKCQYTFTAAQVQASGTDTKPCWDFCDETGGGALLGGLDNTYLGKLTLLDGPCKIRGRITAYPCDVMFEGRSGIFATILNNTDRSVKKLLCRIYLKEYINPYLFERCYEVKNDP